MFSLEKIYMSKTEISLGPLVGILTFDLPAKSTRTLSATQAYDILSRTQIVLGSFTGKLTDKSVVVKDDNFEFWGGSVNFHAFGGAAGASGFGAKRDVGVAPTGTVSLTATDRGVGELKSGKAVPVYQNRGVSAPDGVTFEGNGVLGNAIAIASSSKSKATNANTTYYGAITVGLGKYKKWQGNYAVLKINTVTEKAILRIYDA